MQIWLSLLTYLLFYRSWRHLHFLNFVPLLLAGFAAVSAQSTCSPYRLVWISCTGSGNTIDFVGNAVLSSLKGRGFNVDGSFVQYPASTPRDISTQQGADQLKIDMTKYVDQCPDQAFILGGYSQGVIVLHRASLTQDIIKRITAVTVFGDPDPESSYYPICEASRVVAVCGNSDPWCNDPKKGPRNKSGGVQNLAVEGDHQVYAQFADAAVDTIMESITNPFTGQCIPPLQSTIHFDNRLKYSS